MGLACVSQLNLSADVRAMNRHLSLLFLIVCCLVPDFTNAADDALRTWTLSYVEPSYMRRLVIDLLGDDAEDVRIFADDEQNQLIVQGNSAAHTVVQQLLKEIDRPSSATKVSPAEPRELRNYQIPADQLASQEQLIHQTLAGRVRISADPRNSRLIVLAAPGDHDLVTRLLGVKQTAATQSVQANTVAPVKVESADALFPNYSIRQTDAGGQINVTHQFQRITANQCQKALIRLLAKNYRTLSDGSLQYTVDNIGMAKLDFDHKQQNCRISGDHEVASQFVALMEWFERSQITSSQSSIRFVPLRKVKPEVLNRAIRLWAESTQHRRSSETAPSSAEQSRHTTHTRRIQPVAFQEEVLSTDEDLERADLDAAAESSNTDNGDLRPPLTGVRVQPFPGLDVLAVQGKDADVNELIRIIGEIERLSDESKPKVEIYYLKHVDSTTLNTFIGTVIEALTEPLQGRIGITPISKPNALLLLGWGEAVEAAKELIAELDRPVSPDRDMRIITLKNVGTAQVLPALRDALTRTGALGPKASVTANPRTNSLIVYAASRDMAEIERLVQHLDAQTSGTVNKGRIIKLKNSLAADVAATITAAITAAAGGTSGRKATELDLLLVQPNGDKIVASGILAEVSIVPNTRLNTLFVTGPESSLSLVEELIKALDQSPAASAVIKVFEITNGNASDLVSVLRTLFPVTAVGSGVPTLSTAEGEGSLVPVRFSVDVRTNTIIATGTKSDLQVMEALLLRLDGVASQERVTNVYHPRNSPADAIADAVNEYLRSERIVSQSAPGRTNPFEQIQQEVVVVAERTRNQLIISATPRFFDQIMELVRDLDSTPPQVMIQVILAEVNLDNFHEVGVELGIQDSLLFDRSLLGDLVSTVNTSSTSTPAGVVTTTQENVIAASNTPGFNFNNQPLGNSGSDRSVATAGNVAGQGLSHFNVGRLNADLGYGGMVLSASSQNVSVLLRALDRTGSMEILSRPQIMTLDNTEAFIQVGQSVPRIASSSVTQLGQINSLEDTEVGLLLGVVPRINPDGTVVMEVDATRSDVGPESDGIPVFVSTEGTVVRSPRVNITTTRTTVSAASGQTVVIGGLITNSNMMEHRKVPWLGDLPVLGKLFRYDSFANRRTELLVILTPHVILGRADAEYMKQVEMSRMSWVSSDVFELLDNRSEPGTEMNQGGVDVIYPDETPNIPYQATPPPVPDFIDSDLPPASEDMAPAGNTIPLESSQTKPSSEEAVASDGKASTRKSSRPVRSASLSRTVSSKKNEVTPEESDEKKPQKRRWSLFGAGGSK